MSSPPQPRSSRRLSTIWDLNSLRLRPDGTRIHQCSTRNHSERHAAYTVQDSRGNWFARDAGGSYSVPKTPRLGGRKRKPLKDKRALKRQKFNEDWSFIEPRAENLPSADLLKFIHHFAAQYYDSRGQLFDGSALSRARAKENKRKRQEEAARRAAAGITEPMTPPRRGGRVKGRKKGWGQHRTDMYRVFTGSALVAIAFMLEEWIKNMLKDRKPEEWDQMMEKFYSEEAAREEREWEGFQMKREEEEEEEEIVKEEEGGDGVEDEEEWEDETVAEFPPSSDVTVLKEEAVPCTASSSEYEQPHINHLKRQRVTSDDEDKTKPNDDLYFRGLNSKTMGTETRRRQGPICRIDDSSSNGEDRVLTRSRHRKKSDIVSDEEDGEESE